MNKNTQMITREPEGRVLFRLAGPMLLGILGIIIFNLMDTFYVARLGTIELAALSFTFPVVLVISSVAHGLGIGMTATVSRAAGEENRKKQIGLITWGMILSFIIVLLFVIFGLLTITPLFTLLGADKTTLPVIKEYMSIWYWGVMFVVIPMTGNAAIRGMGDTKTPAMVMLLAAVMNTILDPLLIFGIGPFPEWRVRGAAIATVFSRALTFSVAIYILTIREKVISFKNSTIKYVFSMWKEILHIGLPNTLTKMIIPISVGIITGLIARHGQEAVAGFGVSSRLEMFALLPMQSIISILPVFIGQNIGAKKKGRVLRGITLSGRFALIYGVVSYLFLFFLARPVASLFNDNVQVVDVVIKYFRIVPLTYGLQGLMLIGVTTLNVLKKPLHAAGLTLLQVFGIYIPLALLSSHFLGISGIFISLILSYMLIGPISYVFSQKKIQAL